MKKQKIHYDVSVYLDQPYDEKNAYRLRFYHKATKTYLKEYEERFARDSFDKADSYRMEKQVQDKFKNFNQKVLKIVPGDFLTYMRELANEKPHEETKKLYLRCVETVEEFYGKNVLLFEALNRNGRKIAADYREWLLKRFPSQGTASHKYGFFCQALKKAENDEHVSLLRIPVKRIPLKTMTEKEILTEDDLNLLLATPYVVSNRVRNYFITEARNYREIFLFECLTGMSYSDMRVLKWKQIENKTIRDKESGQLVKVTQMTYTRIKTSEKVKVVLSDDIMELLGDRGALEDKVFPCLNSNYTYNIHIERFLKSAGITKHITSHCGRATAIVRVIESEGIFQAAKQVGHNNIETTMKYGKYTDNMMLGNSKALTRGLKFKPDTKHLKVV